jgi:hypothetical protein
MQEQFPMLIRLVLDFQDYIGNPVPVLPDEFLCGSAPSLQFLELCSVPFPTLPKLLLSATQLVRLTLEKIPDSGYISPEAIVTSLATLADLKYLTIEFESSLSLPSRESRRPSLPTRIVLPALTHLQFQGPSEYLEDLVARVDAPLLDCIWITFFHRHLFDILQLVRFMRRTTSFQALNEAHVVFESYGVQVRSLPLTRTFDEKSGLRILCRSDWELSSQVQDIASLFPSIYVVEHLHIYPPRHLLWRATLEDMQWLEIFHSFTALKNLYICKELAHSRAFAATLQELVEERGTNMLPSLNSLFIEDLQSWGFIQEATELFVTARQLLGQRITVSLWERDHEVGD